MPAPTRRAFLAQSLAATAVLSLNRAAAQPAGFRLAAFRTALKHLAEKKPHRAKRVLLSFSDPTTKPLAKATVKGATGAWHGAKV